LAASNRSLTSKHEKRGENHPFVYFLEASKNSLLEIGLSGSGCKAVILFLAEWKVLVFLIFMGI
jgi:hypothetical protein